MTLWTGICVRCISEIRVEHKSQVVKKSILLTIASAFCVAIPTAMMGLWISAFNSAETQTERVRNYSSNLPQFMHDTTVSTLVSIAFCLLAIGLSAIALKASNKPVKLFNIILIAVGGAIMALNVFSLL